MAYIILSDARMRTIFERAKTHLILRGHNVDICDDAVQMLNLIDIEQPNVMVLSSSLHKMNGYTFLKEMRSRFPGLKTKLAWIATLREEDSSPAISWEFEDISSFLMFPCSEWQLVLSVEQLIYREVALPKANT